MQTDVARKITALASRRELLSESDVSHLMTLSRKYLEHMPREEREEYPFLKFFSNWALHITLDRSLEGMAILKRLNDTLAEVAPVPDNDLITRRITEILSFRQLRREMGGLFQRLEVPQAIDADQERWTNFAKHLIEIIRDCPLVFSEKMTREARELYNATTANPLREGVWVIGVSVVEVDYGQFSGSDPKMLLCVCVLLSNTTRIVVPMTAREVFGHQD